jgi:acyl dehydratase
MAEPLVIPDVASLKRFVGTELGPSDWVTVTQKRIELFADATDDHQWIHVDPERAARESPFGGTVAHGYLTLSMAPVLLSRVLRVDQASMTLNYGLEKLRLHAPVRAGARIRFRGRIQSVRYIPGGSARVVISMTIELEGAAKPAVVAEPVLVYLPRRSGAP